jgi:hypothetical protein
MWLLCRENAPSWTRTSGLLLRRESLYPSELSGLTRIVASAATTYDPVDRSAWGAERVFIHCRRDKDVGFCVPGGERRAIVRPPATSGRIVEEGFN